MRRPALIFDFGNVVAHFDYRRASARFGGRLGLTGDEFQERLWALGLRPILQAYESGQIRAEAFSRRVCALAGLDVAHDEFAAAWSDIFALNEPVARLVAALKRCGYTLVLGSNTNDLHAAQFRTQFAETLAHFDRLILSYELGHIKPSPAFYHACAEAAGAAPEHCVFIDDLEENVAGAREAGLVGLRFHDVPRLLREFRSLGVALPEAL